MNDLTIGAKPIRQPDEQSFGAAVRITLAIFLLATPFFLYMGLSAAHVQDEYRLSRLVESRRQLMKEHERLLLTRDALLSPGTVNNVARNKLGMVEEDPQEWTIGVPPVKKGGEIGRGGDGAGTGPAVPGRGTDVGSDLDGRAAVEPIAHRSLLAPVPSSRDATGGAVANPSPAASGSGRVTNAVTRPKPGGGPARTSVQAPPSKKPVADPAKMEKTGPKTAGRMAP